jgi:hypothetical protein
VIEKMCARRAMEGCSRQPDGQGSVAINPMARGSVFGVERLILLRVVVNSEKTHTRVWRLRKGRSYIERIEQYAPQKWRHCAHNDPKSMQHIHEKVFMINKKDINEDILP